MTSREKLTIEQLEHYKNTYYKYEGIESSEFDQICDELIELKKENQNLKEVMKNREEGTIELIKTIKILKLVIEMPMENDIDYVDSRGNNLYKLRIKRLLGEEAYNLVKEVFENVGDKCG